MRISDWSSDVCSSDLLPGQPEGALRDDVALDLVGDAVDRRGRREHEGLGVHAGLYAVPVGKRAVGAEDLDPEPDRKSVVSGKSVSVRVDPGGRRIIKKKKTTALHDSKNHQHIT